MAYPLLPTVIQPARDGCPLLWMPLERRIAGQTPEFHSYVIPVVSSESVPDEADGDPVGNITMIRLPALRVSVWC